MYICFKNVVYLYGIHELGITAVQDLTKADCFSAFVVLVPMLFPCLSSQFKCEATEHRYVQATVAAHGDTIPLLNMTNNGYGTPMSKNKTKSCLKSNSVFDISGII